MFESAVVGVKSAPPSTFWSKSGLETFVLKIYMTESVSTAILGPRTVLLFFYRRKLGVLRTEYTLDLGSRPRLSVGYRIESFNV